MKQITFLSIALAMSFAGAAEIGKAPVKAQEVLILSTTQGQGAARLSSNWRYFETWQTEVVRTEKGNLVRVDSFLPNRRPVKDKDPDHSGPILVETTKVTGSAFPPNGWQKPEFDDGSWILRQGPMLEYYRSLAEIALRGKFEVTDPATVSDLTLSVKFEGGAVAYLNGEEVGRSGLPEGEIVPDTCALDYPKEVYVVPGDLEKLKPFERLANRFGNGKFGPNFESLRDVYRTGTEEGLTRILQRYRTLDVKFPGKLLRKGINVLALEFHRAPAHEVMFGICVYSDSLNALLNHASTKSWNRCAVAEIKVAGASAAGVVPNVMRPKGFQVWNHHPLDLIPSSEINWGAWFLEFGDPCEKIRPIQISGLKNGSYAGQVVAGSDEAIHDLKVTVTDLKGSAGSIPAAAIQIGYGQTWNSGRGSWIECDRIEARAPAEVPVNCLDRNKAKSGALQPIVTTVTIPRDAQAGTYTGTVTISARGEKPIGVPIEVKVIGDWTLPDAKEFKTIMAIEESFESVAMQYNVPLWSDEHFKHLEKVFQLLAQVGENQVSIPLIAKTQLGNSQSMVRYVRQPDGSHKPDYSLAERYLDLAQKYFNIKIVMLDINMLEDDRAKGPTITEWDPAAKTATDVMAPLWTSPEAAVFWKPVLDGMNEILAKRGLDKVAVFGMAFNDGLGTTGSSLLKIAPQTPWITVTHIGWPKMAGASPTAWTCQIRNNGGTMAVGYDPDAQDPANQSASKRFGWRGSEPRKTLCTPRSPLGTAMHQSSSRFLFRTCAEGALISSDVALQRGIGFIGADYWAVLNGNPMASRYFPGYQFSVEMAIWSLLAPGQEGPVPTIRFQMMREALQDAEARIFVQDATDDSATQSKLGDEGLATCRKACLDRTRFFRYCTTFWGPEDGGYEDLGRYINPCSFTELSEQLYQAADVVAKALKK